MSNCQNKIVTITYPKNCCPDKVNSSNELLYNGPALPCVDVQTGESFNAAVKQIDELLCELINELTTTTTSTTTIAP
jgi:hypothetical protein